MQIRNCAAVISLCLVVLSCGCSYLSSGPSDTAMSFFRHVEKGEIGDAAQLYSSGYINTHGGPDKVKSDLVDMARTLKDRGGVKSIQVTKEEVFGELADVTIKVVLPDGTERRAVRHAPPNNGMHPTRRSSPLMIVGRAGG
jgi:hypothetical protein